MRSLLVLLFLLVLAAPARADHLTVSTAADDGAGSLRAAIVEANGDPGADTITLPSGLGTIALQSGLPVITAPVQIDANNNTIEGSAAGAGADGLSFAAAANRSGIDGLGIADFAGDGLVASGAGMYVLNMTITGNAGAGVRITDGSDLSTVQLSTISANRGPAVVINHGSTHALVRGNTVHGNGGTFVIGDGPNDTASYDTVYGNYAYDNGGLWLDLGGDGPTPNDLGDADEGPDHLVNSPVILAADDTGSQFDPVRVSGTLDATPGTKETVVIYSDGFRGCDGQPTSNVGQTDVTTDASGHANFSVDIAEYPGEAMWASTLTSDGDTSEASNCMVVNQTKLADMAADLGGPLAPAYTAVAYRLVVTQRNLGVGPALGDAITVTLPDGLRFGDQPPFSGCAITAQSARCVGGTELGAGGFVDSSLSIVADRVGTFPIKAVASSDSSDSNSANDATEANLAVVPVDSLWAIPVSGSVTVSATTLTSVRLVPAGARFDARHGRVSLVSATSGAVLDSGRFTASGAAGVTARLTGTSRCGRPRRLITAGFGPVHVIGRTGTASAGKGGHWLTEDRCEGTYVHVLKGTATVRRQGHKKPRKVQAGHSFLARRRLAPSR